MDKKHIIYDIETFPRIALLFVLSTNGKGIAYRGFQNAKTKQKCFLNFFAMLKNTNTF